MRQTRLGGRQSGGGHRRSAHTVAVLSIPRQQEPTGKVAGGQASSGSAITVRGLVSETPHPAATGQVEDASNPGHGGRGESPDLSCQEAGEQMGV